MGRPLFPAVGANYHLSNMVNHPHLVSPDHFWNRQCFDEVLLARLPHDMGPNLASPGAVQE